MLLCLLVVADAYEEDVVGEAAHSLNNLHAHLLVGYGHGGEIAEKGDVIYSHTAFAYYNGSTWRGTLSALEPGQGYIYHSETWEDRMFTYPTEYVSGSNGSSNHHWTVDNYHIFKRHFPVVAVLKLEGQIIDATSDLEVAAFNADGIIGSGSALDGADGDPYPLFGIPVYDDEQHGEVYFKLYDRENED